MPFNYFQEYKPVATVTSKSSGFYHDFKHRLSYL